MAKLTAKQEKFVQEYLVDLNATQAAIRAGYKAKNAYQTGAENLRKPQIAEALQEARKKQETRTQITADRVLQALADIAFADPGEYQTVEGGELTLTDTERIPAGKRRALQGYRIGKGGPEAVLADKLRALELLGKHLGIFEKPEEQDAGGVKVSLAPEMEDWSE